MVLLLIIIKFKTLKWPNVFEARKMWHPNSLVVLNKFVYGATSKNMFLTQ